jgi:core-2/I-Branching enzyme
MKIAYLILAHNTPRHLSRLVAALSSESSGFFIHLDRKSNEEDFRNIEGPGVHLAEERVAVYWGDFSQVEATLLILRAALADPRDFDRFVLLSGSDYPLRSASFIEQFFARNADKEFINLVTMPSQEAGKPLSRLTTYRVRPGEPTVGRIVRKALMKLRIQASRRDYTLYLRDLVPYGGSTWWGLSREACEHVVSFVDRESQVVAFFKNTVCPDESFFQTILGNSRFKSRIARNLTYTDWSEGSSSPAVITDKHLEFFRGHPSFPPDSVYGEGEMLFARKFPDGSESLVASLREQIEEQGAPAVNKG